MGGACGKSRGWRRRRAVQSQCVDGGGGGGEGWGAGAGEGRGGGISGCAARCGCHPIPPGLNRYVVTLSELCRFVSVAPSEVGTLYCCLGVLAIGERSYGHVRVCAANIYLIPGNPHGV